MRQFDVVNTIVDIVFSGKTTGNYVESQTETTLDCKPKIYIVHGGTLRDHLKNKKETARLTARALPGGLFLKWVYSEWGTRLDFTRSLRMASVAAPSGPRC